MSTGNNSPNSHCSNPCTMNTTPPRTISLMTTTPLILMSHKTQEVIRVVITVTLQNPAATQTLMTLMVMTALLMTLLKVIDSLVHF